MIRPLCMACAVAVAAGLIGCGSATRPAASVQSGTCQGDRGGGHVVLQSCLFLLSDGEQFKCRLAAGGKAFEGRMPTVAVLERSAACRRLASLKLSTLRAVLAEVDHARGCLKAKGMDALAGLPPKPPGARTPDGEVVLSKSHALVAFYTNPTSARLAEPAIARSASRSGGQVERRGAATILWTRTPSAAARSAIEGCVPR